MYYTVSLQKQRAGSKNPPWVPRHANKPTKRVHPRAVRSQLWDLALTSVSTGRWLRHACAIIHSLQSFIPPLSRAPRVCFSVFILLVLLNDGTHQNNLRLFFL